MDLTIFLKILASLSVVTEKDQHGNTVAAVALYLKQALEIIAKDPAAAQHLNQIIAQSVCNDAQSFEALGQFVGACLTQGRRDNIPLAVQQFERMTAQVAVQ